MKHTKLYIRFFAVLSKQNKRGYCPIRCIISFNKASKKFSTGIFIDPSNWSKDDQTVTEGDVDHIAKNGLLQTISSKLQRIELELQLESQLININAIYDRYKGVNRQSAISVTEFYDTYVNKLEKLIDKDIKLSTWKKFKYIKDHVAQFVKLETIKNTAIDKLDISFLEEFEYWLKVTKNQKQITINKTIQRFRKPFKAAVNQGLLPKDPFADYKTKTVSNRIVFLTPEELVIFQDTTLVQSRLDLVRQLFIFCCYSGLAYAEMTALNRTHIQKGFDGKDWIIITRLKTSKTISIPLLPKANRVLLDLDFYSNNSLPKLSNQRFNSYLKEIAVILDINKRLTHHTARKTFASTVLLYNDVPMEIVQKLLGHSSITITEQSYGKILNKQVSKELAKFYLPN
ncbi:site-specific integrase [Nonlabens marinus]|uniref:Tyrosine type site-specific recombinase n=1 Tax=Nonlabens marinus S1-08 TaxID=1454201 RepID=W8VZQ8_9FLAO|nr:site-specific integrase [Nonlabens marinus]BAO55001.1 tyrosine type site-specific recombinase [Nonlabens marinus S1-08]